MKSGWPYEHFGEFEPVAASSRRLPERFLTEVRLLENPTGPLTHMFDALNGIIRIAVRGTWSPDDVDRHLARIELMIGLLRTRLLCIRSLIDLREAHAQPASTSERLATAIERIRQPHDRIAIVVASGLIKGRLNHIIGTGAFEAFLSPASAETWLTAYDQPPVLDRD